MFPNRALRRLLRDSKWARSPDVVELLDVVALVTVA